MLSQFGCLPDKTKVVAAMQGPLKKLFLGPILILFSTGSRPESSQTKTMPGGTKSQATRSGKKAPRCSSCLSQQRRSYLEKLALLCSISPRKLREQRGQKSTTPSKRGQGKMHLGSLLYKKYTSLPILGQLSCLGK